ncbi:flippase [Thiomicrorhabdus sp. 6S2-11]|uniref:Flippase n=1 Tax=Thiomicrorhabdus marina TaxID=2818442 RepID=A0ABS3Q200_9GAMM|nr:flippase [Thiomicrorhabdus marina]MBO1926353.1 flippase [Thiomicrorhabdus marina]
MISKLLALKNHQGFIRYFTNTSWMMAEQFLRIIAGLFVGIWVARYLGPEQFGLFSYVLAFTAIFGGIAKLGLDGIMVRELVNFPEKRDVFLGTAFWLKIIGAFMVMGLMAVIVPFTSNDATTNTFIFIIAAGLIFQSFEVVEFYFQSQVLAKIVSICKVIQLALSSVIKIYLVLNEAELIWFVLVTAFDAFSLAISYFIAYKINQHSSFYKHFDLSIAKQLLKDSWPQIITGIAVLIYMKSDQVMIQYMIGSYYNGLYSAAVNLYLAWVMFPYVLTISVFPLIVKLKDDVLKYERFLVYLSAFVFWTSMLVFFIILLVGDLLINLTYGVEYKGSAIVLVILMFASAFTALGSVSGRYLTAENMLKKVASRTVIGAILNVILNFLLIPKYGIVGAAISSLISLAFANYVLNYFDNKMDFIQNTHNKGIFIFAFVLKSVVYGKNKNK